jgi:hypothetical protein
VDRTILNSMADWELFLLGVGGITALALGGFLLMRRLLRIGAPTRRAPCRRPSPQW